MRTSEFDFEEALVVSLRESSAIDPRKQSRTLARNQSLFREVNEQIKRLSVRHSLVDVELS